MITNHCPNSRYFHALIEFERDLPAARLCDTQAEAFGDQHRPAFGAGSAQLPEFRNPPSGGGCAEEFSPFSMSQLGGLEAV